MSDVLDKILISEDTFKEKMDNIAIAIHSSSGGGSGSLGITSYSQVQAIVRAGLAPKVFAIGDQIVVNRATAVTGDSDNSGLSIAVVLATFVNKKGEAATKDYEFTFDGLAWHDESGNTVVLSQYGITITGSPVEDDKIVISEVASEIAFDIIGFDVDTPKDARFTHSMTLQTHGQVIKAFQFDESELMYYSAAGLAAGKYKLTLDHGAYSAKTDQDDTYVFTTSSPIPAGGGFRHTTMGQYQSPSYTKTQITAGTFTTYKADYDTVETGLACTIYNADTDTDAVDLGKFSTRKTYLSAEELANRNSLEKQRYGSNNYMLSAVRQWINSSAAAGAWWTSKHIFDRPNSSKASAGFLYGLDPAFLSVLGLSDKDFKTETVWDGVDGSSVTHTFSDLFFLLSNKEVMIDAIKDEGVVYPYWNEAIPTASNVANNFRIKYAPDGAANNWWMRTAYRGYGNYVYIVTTTGANRNDIANYSLGVAPACVVI